MKKQKMAIIIVLIVAICAVGTYMALSLAGGLETLVSGSAKDKTEEIVNMEGVVSVQYTNETETLTLTKNGEEWVCEESAETKLVSVYVEEQVKCLTQITGERVSGAKKADCGLESPAYKLVLKNADQEITIFFGDAGSNHYYAMLDGETEIYSVDEEVINVMQKKVADFEEVKEGLNSYFLSQDDQETEQEQKEADGETTTTTDEDDESDAGDDEGGKVGEVTPAS